MKKIKSKLSFNEHIVSLFYKIPNLVRIGLNLLENRLMNTISRILQDDISITTFKSGSHLRL